MSESPLPERATPPAVQPNGAQPDPAQPNGAQPEAAAPEPAQPDPIPSSPVTNLDERSNPAQPAPAQPDPVAFNPAPSHAAPLRATPRYVPDGASVGSRLWASVRRQWPQILVIAVALTGITVVGNHHFRRGSFIIGLALLLHAGLRAVLPNRHAGWLAIRSRLVDAATSGAMGVALLWLTLWVPRP